MSKREILEDITPIDDETRVLDWRLRWLLEGGFSPSNAEILARNKEVDFRYAIQVLSNCKEKGYDENFVMRLIS